MIRSLNHSPWPPSARLLRPRPPPVASCPAAFSHRHRCLSLYSLHQLPKGFLSQNPPPLFECHAAREAQPTIFQQKILDLCFWKGPLRGGGFGKCCLYAGLLSAAYASYTVAAKRILDVFPYPWLLSGVYLTSGFIWTSVGWLTDGFLWTFFGLEGPQPPGLNFWNSLFPVAVANAIGHVAGLVCLSRSSPAFAEIMRCGGAVFGVPLMSCFLLGGKPFPLPVYLSLLPILGGCTLAAFTELHFDKIGFIAAIIANFAFASMNALLQRGINKGQYRKKNGEAVKGHDFAAYLSLLSLIIITPFALAIDGPRLWVAGLNNAPTPISTSNLITILVSLSMVYSNHIDAVYGFLSSIQPFAFFTLNTLRKIFIIVFSMTFIKPVHPINALGAAIAILGVFLHSRELCKYSESKAGSCNKVGFLISCC